MFKKTTDTFILGLAVICVGALSGLMPVHAQPADFSQWVEDTKNEAINKGISEATVAAAFADIELSDRVLELDRKQPESTRSFEQYMELVINDQRKDLAVEAYMENREALLAASRTYGVQPEYIVALWAVESNFGERMGDFSIVHALSTLAYDGRRSSYFKTELFNALKIIDEGHIAAEDMLGSWAGAMGQCQFMPSSFLSYAKDGDGDGKKDIWNTKKDVFASIANYLASVGWDDSIGWGAPVRGGNAHAITSYKDKMSLQSWNQQGIQPTLELSWQAPMALVSGNHDNSGPYFMVSKNYDNILKWNRSRYFAIAVGTLADHIRQEVGS